MSTMYRRIPSDSRFTAVGPMTEAEGNQLLEDLENLQNGFTASGTFVSPYDYLIAPNVVGGTTYYTASNAYQSVYGGSGSVGCDGTSFSAVFHKALSVLTHTRPERIAVKGACVVDAKLEVTDPYSTILDFSAAKLTAIASLNDDMIYVSATSYAAGWGWKIIGGILDGNKANLASGNILHIGPRCQRFFVGGGGMRLINAKQNAIYMAGASSQLIGVGTFSHIDIEDAGAKGIYGTTYGADCQISNINIGGSGESGIQFDSGNNANVISSCQLWNNTEYGIFLYDSDANTVVGNRIDQNGKDGVAISEGATNNTVSGNTIFQNSYGAALTYAGINIYNANYNHIVGNNMVGVPIGSADYEQFAIREHGTSDYNQITGNNVYGNYYPSSGISSTGTNSKVANNLGYVTEKQGTGTIASGATQVTINHGCSYTPAAGDITITRTNFPTNAVTYFDVQSITSTQFTVYINADPGASGFTFGWAVRKS